MSPTNHPPAHRLLAYVTGTADVPARLLVETHLSFCSVCMREVGRLGAPGGLVLEAMPEAPVPPPLFERIWREASRHEPPTRMRGLPLPTSLLAELPPPAHWRWHSLLSEGSRVTCLTRDGQGRSALFLVHLRAGARFPMHSHQGHEDTLVVAGGVWDAGRFLEAGDWNSAPAGSRHMLSADSTEGCWALAREDDEVRLSGWRGVLQRAASLRSH